MRRGDATLADAEFAHAGGGAHVAVRPRQDGLWVPNACAGGRTRQPRTAPLGTASYGVRSRRSLVHALAIRLRRTIMEPGRAKIASRLAVGGGAFHPSSAVASLRLIRRQATLQSVVD